MAQMARDFKPSSLQREAAGHMARNYIEKASFTYTQDVQQFTAHCVKVELVKLNTQFLHHFASNRIKS